jgi:nicotinate-nucleotide adenylyltransferase
MNIGLFGGTFDPIHLGHITIAAAAREAVPLDEVHFIPCRRSPAKAKPTVAGSDERCEMIELAIAALPWAKLSRIELQRPLHQPGYSWQTVAAYRHSRPGDQLFWILGDDQWNVIDSWARPEYLARAVTFVVFPRHGRPLPRPGFRMIPIEVRHPASATAIREQGATEFLNPNVRAYAEARGLYTRKAH